MISRDQDKGFPPVYGHLVTLQLIGADIVHLAKGTFMWVQVTHFEIDPRADDRSILAMLISSDGYVHDYASPFPSEAARTEPPLHGRWFRSAISTDRFRPCASAHAESVLFDGQLSKTGKIRPRRTPS